MELVGKDVSNIVRISPVIEDGRLVWNYGREFSESLNPCACASCFTKKLQSSESS